MSLPAENQSQGLTATGQGPRLKLSMPSPARANFQMAPGSTHELVRRPSFSPVTPPFARITSDTAPNQAKFMTEPEAVPVDLEDNPDAIALEAAISILQMQKKQAREDLKQLKKMKTAAEDDPGSFVAALEAGKLTKPTSKSFVDVHTDDEDEQVENSRSGSKIGSSEESIGPFPNPQAVVRAPSINWAKYHIVGEPLDRMHLEQQQRPEPGQPRRDDYGRPAKHAIAAPYRPLVDHIDGMSQSKSEKKD